MGYTHTAQDLFTRRSIDKLGGLERATSTTGGQNEICNSVWSGTQGTIGPWRFWAHKDSCSMEVQA